MRFVSVRLLLTLVVGLVPLATRGADAPAKLNILFCFADDWGRYASAYAAVDKRPSPNDVVKTPNIDRIASNGTLFRSAFVNAPSCTPCRSALLSGRYFFNTGRGAILQGAQWDSSIPSWPLLLRDAGYHIGETWKVWSPGTPNDAPFGGGKYGYEKSNRGFVNFSENATRMVKDGTPFDEVKTKLLTDVSDNFGAFLADRKPGQPFCYWFGPTNVHRAWAKGSGKALWGINPDDLQGKLPKFLPDVPEVRADFADYLGEIQAWDAGIGVLLKKLEEIGELDRTLVVASGDHGAPGFPGGKCNLYDFGVGVTLAAWWPGKAKGRVVDDLVNLMDLAPTFLEVGGSTLPPGLNGRSLVNVLTSDKSGQIDPARNYVITGRERHVGIAREDNLPYPQRSYRTHDFLYIRNFKPDRWPMGAPYGVKADAAPSDSELSSNTRVAFADMDASPTKAWLVANRNDPQWKWHYDYAFAKRPLEELYDLKKDPDQTKNVADDPAYTEKKKELGEKLLKTLAEVGDPRVTGDGGTFDRPPFSDPEQVGQNKKKAAAKKAEAK